MFCCATRLVSMCPTELFLTLQVLNSDQHIGMRTMRRTAVLVGNFLFGIIMCLVFQHVNRPSCEVHFLQFSYYIDTCKLTLILALSTEAGNLERVFVGGKQYQKVFASSVR